VIGTNMETDALPVQSLHLSYRYRMEDAGPGGTMRSISARASVSTTFAVR
jgi:hypothetical protein